jgi:hypothetical protein
MHSAKSDRIGSDRWVCGLNAHPLQALFRHLARCSMKTQHQKQAAMGY